MKHLIRLTSDSTFTATADGTRFNYFDPYGRVFQTDRAVGDNPQKLYEMWLGYNDYGDIEEHDLFHAAGDNVIATFNAYDALGQLIAVTNALGGVEHTTFDAQGQVIASSGTVYPVQHGYDTAGRRTTLGTTRDGLHWDTTRWGYDAATGLATNKLYADNSAVSYTHTADGRLASRTWARGISTEYSYDEAQLLTGTQYSDATPVVILTYDGLQRLSAATNSVASYTYANSNAGSVTNETANINGNSHHLRRNHDQYHRQISLTVDGSAVHYGYNSQGRLLNISNDIFVLEYNYTADGYDSGYMLSSGNLSLERVLQRDQYRRHLITSINNHINGAPQTPINYTYDQLNRVTKRNQDTFGYNPRSEVTSANIATNGYAYAYDDIGNLLSSALSAPPRETFYTANELNQYTNILRASAPPRELEYDPDGNLLDDGTFTYTWDAEYRLIAVYSGNTLVVSNAYDHQSRRVLKVTPVATHTFLHDGWNLVQETITTSSNTSTNSYVWGKDLSGTLQGLPAATGTAQAGAGGVGGLLAVCINNSCYFPFYDNNGNITAYVAEDGTVVAEYRYDAFGNTIAQSGPMADAFPHRFSTKYYDAETGLYYYGYRFYSPVLMRWLNRDPIGEDGGMNLYRFLFNGCSNKTDPLGLRALVLDVGDTDGSPDILDISSTEYHPTFALIDKMLSQLTRVPNEMFENVKKQGKVFFNNKKFQGSKSDFINLLKREKESRYVILQSGGYAGSMARYAALAQLATYGHDYLVFAAHGLATVTESIGKVRITGEDVALEQVASAVKNVAAAMGTKGQVLLVSCYQTWKKGTRLKDTTEALKIRHATGHVLTERMILIPTQNGWEKKKRACSIEFTPIKIEKQIGQ